LLSKNDVVVRLEALLEDSKCQSCKQILKVNYENALHFIGAASVPLENDFTVSSILEQIRKLAE